MRPTGQVLMVMGSDSDLPVAEAAVEVLEELGVSFEVRVASAHRSPETVEELVRQAEQGETGVLIGIAGGAAHLAGVMASQTTLPVIGVPVPTDRMGGMDSLLSTLQMPSGIPVACMGLGKSGARNAAVLAVEILALSDPALRETLRTYKQRMSSRVEDQDARVQDWLEGRSGD